MSEQPATRVWYRFGNADVVFLILLLVIFQAARGKMLSDPGLGWHLRNIDAMIAEGGWLHTDPFSQPQDGVHAEWRTNQWLGELPFWLGERWAGKEGVAAVATLILAFTLRILYTMLLRDGLPWPFAVFWLCIAALACSCSWVARPNLFTLLFTMLTARLVEQFHTGRCSWRALLWLLPLFALWANVHGGFVAGFLILVPALVVEAFLGVVARPTEKKQEARWRGFVLLAVTGGCFLATLLNPYGWTLYPWVLKLLGNPYFMLLNEEWKPPPMANLGALQYAPLFVLFPLIVLLSRKRPNLLEWALAGGWMVLALKGFRYLPIWVLIVVPLMARVSYGIPWVAALVNKHLISDEPSSLFARRKGPAPWGFWSGVAALVFLASSHLLTGRFVQLLPKVVDAPALDQMVKLHEEFRQAHPSEPDPVVFHSYNWGGYLTWHGWRPHSPRLLTWIDDRNEVQGEQHTRDTLAMIDGKKVDWDQVLDKGNVRFVCIESNTSLAKELTERPEKWKNRYEDDYAVIFERRE